METSFESLISSYISNKVGISVDFLSKELCQNLAIHLLQLNATDLLKNASIGNELKTVQNNLIRNDKIHWLDKSHNNEFENDFFVKIDAFVAYLNQSCYTNISSYEFHYSLYEKGSFYKPHFDQFENDNQRQFSMISYLNPNWQPQDGGELHIYQNKDNQMISPTEGKTVFFKSDELKHEVLVTNEQRLSVTGWLKRG
jgi:SM-20-related protein